MKCDRATTRGLGDVHYPDHASSVKQLTKHALTSRWNRVRRDDHRLVLEKLQDIQAVTIAEFHIDNRRIFAQPVLAVFTRRLPIVCVVILGRRPEMEHHLTAATCDFDSCGTQFFYGSNDKRVPGYVCKSRPHPRPSIEPFCKMSKRISLRNVHAGDCSAVSKDTRQSVRASGIPSRSPMPSTLLFLGLFLFSLWFVLPSHTGKYAMRHSSARPFL